MPLNRKKPEILLVTRNLPPLVGGMERLVWHLAYALGEIGQLRVIGPRKCASSLVNAVSVSEVTVAPLARFFVEIVAAMAGVVLVHRPEIVVAGSGLTAPFALLGGRLSGAKCVVYLHGLDVEEKHPIYRLFFRSCFKYFDLVIVNSSFTQQLALKAGVSSERMTLIHPGVDLPEVRPESAGESADFRLRYGLGNGPILLYVGRLTARKGLSWFIEHCFAELLRVHPTAKLVVIGEVPIFSASTVSPEKEKIVQSMRNQGIDHGAIVFLGELDFDDPEISHAYFAADVHVFPVQFIPGDGEGFGMVAVEAAAHGLTTVAFRVGGVADAVLEGITGWLIPPGDKVGFIEKILDVLSGNAKLDRMEAAEAARTFSWHQFNSKVKALLLSGKC